MGQELNEENMSYFFNSLLNCLIASKKGNPSISPTVPPISHKQKSILSLLESINSLISSVT